MTPQYALQVGISASAVARSSRGFPSACVLAFWHHPRFSSGFVGDSSGVGALRTTLYDAHAHVVLNRRDHLYERYAQQDPSGTATTNGIREFAVGTGRKSLAPYGQIEANLQSSDRECQQGCVRAFVL